MTLGKGRDVSLCMDVVGLSSGGGPLREGFLCPFCIKDLGDIMRLQTHVQTYHKETTQPSDAIKGFFDKAKQKILKFDNPLAYLDAAASSSTAANASENDDDRETKNAAASQQTPSPHVQEPGTSRSHNEYFFEQRGRCIDDAIVKTNNLIIRLDKLVNQGPNEGHGRKEYEKEMVSWKDDNEVKMCPLCCSNFHTLSRRRHHCRLCGSIMCSSCSVFLTFSEARKQINPLLGATETGSFSFEPKEQNEETMAQPGKRSSVKDNLVNAFRGKGLASVREKGEKFVFSAFSRSNREAAGNETARSDKINEDGKLRLCISCFNLLEKWKEKVEYVVLPHPLVPLYEDLCGLLREAHKLAPTYMRMAESLNKGETLYSLELAVQLRKKIDNLQRRIDILSSEIETLGEGEPNISPRELALQKQIRYLAIQTMQEVVWQLSPLPNEEEFKRLVEERHFELSRQADLEYKTAYSSSSPTLQSLGATVTAKDSHPTSLKEVPLILEVRQSKGDQGWVPGSQSRLQMMDNDASQINPIEEQVFNIKGYLNQAIKDGRLEEVKILEQNLHDLLEELRRQKTAVPPN